VSFENAIKQILDVIMEEFPELAVVFEEAKDKNQSEEVAMGAVMEAISKNPEMAEILQEKAMAIMAPLRAESDTLKPETTDGPGIVFDSGVGLPRLNPLYEAALVERAQYDGDMPEFRTGPLPPDMMPSVSVDTDTRDPAALGHMLDKASRDVLEEVQEARQKVIGQVEDTAAEYEGENALALKGGTDMTLANMAKGSAETDPESYRRGTLPAPKAVEAPSGGMLATMAPEERREAAWGFLSTSQGRRSAVKSIQEGMSSRLKAKGLVLKDQTPGTTPAAEDIIAYAEWTMDLSGPNSTQAEFSLIDVAIGAMTIRLLDNMPWPIPEVSLEVYAINTVDVGSVGWAARLVER
jgi:hypothetical protein